MPPSYATADQENGDVAIHSDETRTKMIHAAIEVFGALGYEGASMRTLAERAELGRHSLSIRRQAWTLSCRRAGDRGFRTGAIGAGRLSSP